MILEKIFAHARTDPGRPALYYGGRVIGYGTFAFWVSHAREFLARQDLRAGSLAVLDIDSLVDSWVLGLALRSLGLTTIAVRALDTIDELQLHDIGCVIMSAQSDARMPSIATPHKLVRVPHHMYLGMQARGASSLPEMLGPPGGHILLTSGTTGVSKKVLIGENSFMAEMPRRYALYGLTPDSVIDVFGFSMWASVGYNIPACVWTLGAAAIIHQGADMHRSLSAADVTHAFFTPAMLSDFLKAPANAFERRSALKAYVTGGPLPRALAEEAKARLTPLLHNFIGSTEVGTWAVTLIGSAEDLHLHHVHPTSEVQIVDEADRLLPVGQTGAVRVRAMDGVSSYLDDEDASRSFFRGGYFYPGDVGAYRPDGRLVLLGRVTNVLNVLGDKMQAEPVEQALQDRLGAEGVCVFSHASGASGEELHVVIHARRRIEEAELTAAIHAELPRFPHAHVHFIGQMPRNDMGKIDRARLKQRLLSPPESG